MEQSGLGRLQSEKRMGVRGWHENIPCLEIATSSAAQSGHMPVVDAVSGLRTGRSRTTRGNAAPTACRAGRNAGVQGCIDGGRLAGDCDRGEQPDGADRRLATDIRRDRREHDLDRDVGGYRYVGPPVATGSEAGLPASPAPDKPSLAVLPLSNLSGDPAQDYFSDGITGDIIAELSRFRSLFVVARHSSFAYRGKTTEIKRVGRELGVRYVAEGSVRKIGDRVRVTVQLLDAASGYHLWTERYERELDDIFALQDEIVRAIVAALPGRLEDAGREIARRKPTSSITAYDLVLLGNER